MTTRGEPTHNASRRGTAWQGQQHNQNYTSLGLKAGASSFSNIFRSFIASRISSIASPIKSRGPQEYCSLELTPTKKRPRGIKNKSSDCVDTVYTPIAQPMIAESVRWDDVTEPRALESTASQSEYIF
ncbi:hypothetical protein M404DRAFT_747722 [Pisolithus tinctorius Marx 270]|uniref:Uncharacterized protein n=1 Tax=Pisolithus tinctorius Marx 270 TaxID=870435 RepID=A0A0C3PSE2_PISTI|nr:hypothetical protein M404DRAFT_747722 [Pisolithus tinctorius Marx 270]